MQGNVKPHITFLWATAPQVAMPDYGIYPCTHQFLLYYRSSLHNSADYLLRQHMIVYSYYKTDILQAHMQSMHTA